MVNIGIWEWDEVEEKFKLKVGEIREKRGDSETSHFLKREQKQLPKIWHVLGVIHHFLQSPSVNNERESSF